MKRLRQFMPLLVCIVVAAVLIPLFTLADTEPIELTDLRDRTTKVYDIGGGKYAIDVSISSVHYEDEYGDWQNIETDILPSDKPAWDYEVIKGHWQLLIKDDTTVAIGKGGNWLGFKYVAFGYLDWTTKEYYILQTRQSVIPVVNGNRILWNDIFYGADLEYIYMPDGFKENLYISQDTRDYLTANPPSSYGLNNDTSYLVGVIECDWQLQTFTPEDDAGNPITWNNINEFTTGGVNWRDPILDKVITALPIGVAYSQDSPEVEPVDIRYRFYKDDGTNYLLFGARVTDLNAYPSGTIILDPTVDEQVGASLDDSYEAEQFGINYPTATTVQHRSDSGGQRSFGAHRWASGSFPSAGDTIDVAYIELYFTSSLYDDMDGFLYFQDGTATPAQFSSASHDITDRTTTTASAEWVQNSCGAGWETSPSVVAPLQEVIDNYSPTALVIIFYGAEDSDKNGDTTAYDQTTSLAAKLHIEYTAAGAGAVTRTWGGIIG